MDDRKVKYTTIFDAEASAVSSPLAVNAKDYDDMLMKISGFGSPDATLKIKASLQEDSPQFDQPISATNQWFYVTFFDHTVGMGTELTEYVFTGSDAAAGLLVNMDGATYISAEITAYAAGTINVEAVQFEAV